MARCALNTYFFLSCHVRGNSVFQGPLIFPVASLTIDVFMIFCVGLFQRLWDLYAVGHLVFMALSS